MKQNKNISEFRKLLDDLDKLNALMEPPFSEKKEDIWKKIAPEPEAKETMVTVYPVRRKTAWMVAAALVALIGLTAVFRFYPHTVRSPQKQVVHLTLPDGSSVVLNANTKLTYYPLWWRFSAQVTLRGEAFFSGHHTKGFTVKSGLGTVTVLGTRFDVLARPTKYQVVCFGGKVKVTSLTKKRMILAAGEKAEINPAGEITYSKNIHPGNYSWTREQFIFTAVPFETVLHNLENYYRVKIILKKNISSTYTGNFSTKVSIGQALNIVCKPFGLTFVETGNRVFVVQ